MKTLFLLVIPLLLLSPAWARPSFQAKTDLRRCLVGNQAGLLKVVGTDRKTIYSRGIDDRNLAQMSQESRQALFAALGIERSNLAGVATQLMREPAHKESVAVLGALAGSAELDPATRTKMETFLLKVMTKSKDVQARRQAILALAVLPEIQAETIGQVVNHYEQCQNLWETFPVQQFFEYHAGRVRQASDYTALRSRLQAVNSLYTPTVLGYLDS